MVAVRSPPQVLPGKQPVLAAQDELPKLALHAVVRQLDSAVSEKEHKAIPLPIQVP